MIYYNVVCYNMIYRTAEGARVSLARKRPPPRPRDAAENRPAAKIYTRKLLGRLRLGWLKIAYVFVK